MPTKKILPSFYAYSFLKEDLHHSSTKISDNLNYKLWDSSVSTIHTDVYAYDSQQIFLAQISIAHNTVLMLQNDSYYAETAQMQRDKPR